MTPTHTVTRTSGSKHFWVSLSLIVTLMLSVFAAPLGLRSATAQSGSRALADKSPSSTVLFMNLDLDQTSSQWELTMQLLERSGLGSLTESVTGATADDLVDEAAANNYTGQVAIVFTDANALVSASDSMPPDAGLEVATSLDPGEVAAEIPEGFATIIQPTDIDAFMTGISGDLEQEASDNGEVLQTTDYNGITITYWESTDPSVPATAYAQIDDVVVLATRASDIEPIIDTIQGNQDSLASTDGFNAVSSRLHEDSLSFGYLNVDEILTAAADDPELADLINSEEMAGMGGHGGYVAYAADEGFRFDSVFIPNDPAHLADITGFDATLPKQLPADILFYIGSDNLAGAGIADMLAMFVQESMLAVDSATPAPAMSTDEVWDTLAQQIGFNPNTQMLALLDGEFAVTAGAYDTGDGSGIPSPEFLFVSQTSDAATLDQTATTINNLVAMMGGQSEGVSISSRAVGDSEVTSITLEDAMAPGVPTIIEYGVVNGELLIGLNGAIDRYLDPAEPKLADDANYQRTFELLPNENVISRSYLNIEGQALPLIDMLTTSLMGSIDFPDNDESCGEYASQKEAQAAFESDPNLWTLDMNFNGIACEDYFDMASDETATLASLVESVNVPSAGTVVFVDGDAVVSNSILVVGN